MKLSKQIALLNTAAIAVGSLFLSGTPVMAQAAKPDASTPPANDDIVQLSVFQVDSKKDKGYFAENTLAGSRMNTNIADLGAAISIVTKQQLQDTASLDVNDIFRYELSTEGSTTYTPSISTSKGDGPADILAGASFGTSVSVSTNATANRVRGLGSPSFALNYYQSIAAVPFDSYNAASFEINRGANSMLFGMGSPAGIVNQSLAQASLTKQTAQIQLRIDDRGSNRVSLNVNVPLIKNKLAIFGGLLYNDQQFERKPSYDITRRQYGAITYKPFKTTTIRASIEGYNNSNNRPNSLTPIDGVSLWRNSGSPYYDDANRVIVTNRNGVQEQIPVAYSAYDSNAQNVLNYVQSVVGAANVTIVKGNASYPTLMTDAQVLNPLTGAKMSIFGGLPAAYSTYGGNAYKLYIPGMNTYASSRLLQSIVNGNVTAAQVLTGYNPRTGWNGATALTDSFTTTYGAGTPAKPFIYNTPYANNYTRLATYGGTADARSSNPAVNGMATYIAPGVTDKSVYDWTKVNTLQMNYGTMKNQTYNIELEQEIIHNLLNFSAGWFRQSYDMNSSYTVAQQYSAYLYVDTDKYDTSGRPNANFGKVYVQDYDPDRYEDSVSTNQYRAMLAFTPDFTRNKGWTKWLGRHQILGLVSYYDLNEQTLRRRLAYDGGDSMATTRYMNNTSTPGWALQSAATTIRRYYISTTGNQVANQSSGKIGSLSDNNYDISIRSFDYTTGQNVDLNTHMLWNVYNANSGHSARELTSYSGAWTGYLWSDRIVITAGIRRDINRTRNDTDFKTDQQRYQNGFYQYGSRPWNDWSRLAGTTSTIGGVVRPFSGWESIGSRSSGNLFWEFVENLGFSYNTSGNFDAPTSTAIDFTGAALPKPTGKSTDYGVQFSLFKNKLFARITWFNSTNENAVMTGGNVGTAISRLRDHADTSAYRSWLCNIYMLADGADPSAASNDTTQTAWYQPYVQDGAYSNADKVRAMQDWVGKHWVQGSTDYNYYKDLPGTIGSTSSAEAKGAEITIQYNPTPSWTLKFTGSKNKTVYNDVLKQYDDWLPVRQGAWNNASAAELFNELQTAGMYHSAYPVSYWTNPGGTPIWNSTRTLTLTSNGHDGMTDFWASTNYRDTSSNANTITSDSSTGWVNTKAYYDMNVTPVYLQAKAMEGQQAMDQRKYNFSFLTNYNFDRGILKGWSVGGGQRYSSKAIIGYYGRASGASKDSNGKLVMDMTDVTKPIYDNPMWYTDLWVGYSCKILNDKVRMKLQLNVSDVFENGKLQPVAVNYDGSPYAYRIMDPRTFILTATFDF